MEITTDDAGGFAGGGDVGQACWRKDRQLGIEFSSGFGVSIVSINRCIMIVATEFLHGFTEMLPMKTPKASYTKCGPQTEGMKADQRKGDQMRPTRIHVAIGVSDLESSKSHYSKILRSQPTRTAIDQIDWILDSPPINLSIFHNPERQIGIEHIGFDLPADGLESVIAEADGESVILDPDNVRFELFSSD